MKRKLKDITVIGVDGIDIKRLIKAADQCENFFEFQSVKLLTHLESEDPRVQKIEPLENKADYDKFIFRKLNDFFDTKYVLVIQHDGFILNPNAWDEEYLKYDYIGAPWAFGSDETGVGNGGFSLRSKTFTSLCADFPEELTFDGTIENQEDVLACYTHRGHFESKGIKFADRKIASKFSIEGNEGNNKLWTHQFGFHDFKQTDISNYNFIGETRLNTFYRYSDKGKVPSIEGQPIPKESCFVNFLECFGAQDVHVLVDGSKDEMFKWFDNFGVESTQRTSFGNSKSFKYLAEKVIEDLDEDEVVYFVEDDYLHLRGAKFLIFEGLERADYVTLYDHGDKYLKEDEAINPLVKDGGEESRVIVTKNTHWKTTNSTTMTFAARVKTIKEDIDAIKKHCPNNAPPQDFQLFQHLIKEKNRKLISSIPGRSTHLCPHGYHSPFILNFFAYNNQSSKQ